MSKSNGSGSNTQRTIAGGISGLLILIIALFAQFALGIDILNIEDGGDTADTIDTGAPPLDLGDITPVELREIPGGYDGGWFQLYFTSPINSRDPEDFQDAPIEDALVAAIDGAQQRIDAAIFELNSEPVTDALIRAHERGVIVRIVTDDKHGLDIIDSPDSTVPDLEDAGIPVVDDNRTGLMHNKFFVIDGAHVWTGSTNITHNGFYNNNNSAMLIRSSRLASHYTSEFEEMFTAKSFGKTSPVEENMVVNVDGTPMEVYFESEGESGRRLWQLINEARDVRFMAFSFTDSLTWTDEQGQHYSVMDLLADRAAAGEITWQGIIEASSRSYTEPLFCVDSARMRQDGNPNILHHKVFIIDESIVVMGSFNFSNSAANSNDENLLIIHNPSIAKAYLSEFAKRWRESQAMPADAFGC